MQVLSDRDIPVKTFGCVWEPETHHYRPIQTRIDLGKDLYFPSPTDIGSMLTAKILTQTRQYVCRSTLRLLTNNELACELHKETHTKFDQTLMRR